MSTTKNLNLKLFADEKTLFRTFRELLCGLGEGTDSSPFSNMQIIDSAIAALQEDIKNINTILTSDDTDLDTLQELVTALKNNVSSINDIFTELSKKVDKEEGKGLSTNDFTNELLRKLEALDENLNNYDDTELRQLIADKESKSNLKALAYKDSLNKQDVGLGDVTNDAQVKRSEMGVAGGVATLNENGLIPNSQLPSYVDDVLEYAEYSQFPEVGESGKIYVDVSNNKSYRWGGSIYVEIASSIALGETSSTAYAGDKGKANADAIAEIKENTYTKTEVDSKLKDFDSTNYAVLVGQETVISGSWVGTAVPNTGMVENVYFNTNLSIEEVVSVLSNVTHTMMTDSISVYPIAKYKRPDDSGIYYQIVSMKLNDEYHIFEFEDGEKYFSSTINNDTGFPFTFPNEGWYPEFDGVIEINSEVSNDDDASFGVFGLENDKLSSLISTTPFVQSSGEEVTTLYQMNADGTLNKDKPIKIAIQGASNELEKLVANLQTLVTKAQETADEAKAIALGKGAGKVFETYAEMMNYLKAAPNDEFKVGDNLYIKAKKVPDYWISAILEDNSGNYGYYEISELETAKVDLTDYQTKNLTASITINGQQKTTVEGAIEELNTQKVDVGTVYTKEEIDAELEEIKNSGGTGGNADLTNYYNKEEVDAKLADKVTVETGKVLSTNDYTTEEKTKLAELPTNAELEEKLANAGTGSGGGGGISAAILDVNELPSPTEANSKLLYRKTYSNHITWVGTEVPNKELVEKVYLNTSITTKEEFIEIASKITNYNKDGAYCVLVNSDTTSGIAVIYLPDEDYYGICDLTQSNIYLAFGEFATEVGFEGWNPEFNGVLELNIKPIKEKDGVKFGNENYVLSSLISITPFKEIIDTKTSLHHFKDGLQFDIQNNMEDEFYALWDIVLGDELEQEYPQDLESGGGISVKIVTSLPEVGEKKYIYLVPNNSNKPNNIYEEYLWSEELGAFELVGSTQIDLSGYYTKEEVDTKLTEVDNNLLNKVDKETGKGLSTNDYTTEEKTKLAELQKLTAGNGITISEDGVISLNLDIAENGAY